MTTPKKHRITTIILTYVVTERGSKWRLLRGKTALWSKPATGARALTRDQAIALARRTMQRGGYSRLLDHSKASCLPVPIKHRPGAYWNTRRRSKQEEP